MSRVARVPGLRYWWQLYVFGPPEVRNTLISRARDNGCEALDRDRRCADLRQSRMAQAHDGGSDVAELECEV